MRTSLIAAGLLVTLGVCRVAVADEVVFNNGDRLSGTVTQLDGGKLKIKSAVAGEVTVDLKDVKTFTTDAPVKMRLKDKTLLNDRVEASPPEIAEAKPADAGPSEVVIDGKKIPIAELKKIQPKQEWTGSIVGNGNLSRGNTHSTTLGISADATLRRDDDFDNDRFSLTGGYNFGKQIVGGVNATSADNWFGQFKYDRFFSDKWYGYGVFRYDHDRLAFLNFRLAPGVGVGYQWVESAGFNFSTEAGLSYIYEEYSNDGNQDRLAARLAYHVDKKLNDKVSIFHNLEFLPGLEDPSDYNLITDAGVRAQLTKQMFSEFKAQYLRDNTPAPGADKNDVRLMFGVGWNF